MDGAFVELVMRQLFDPIAPNSIFNFHVFIFVLAPLQWLIT